MKNIIKLLGIIAIISIVSSCEDFLSVEAQDLVIPKTVSQHKELLQGDGYFKNLQANIAWINLMTDDMTMGASQFASNPARIPSLMEKYKNVYLWQAEVESDLFKDNLYAYLYNQVLPANICIEKINEMEGTEKERKVLLGQASFQRALAYFYLANLYGPAYNEAKPTDLCVPMPLSATATPGSYPRKSVQEVWGLIKNDIQTAVESLKDYTTAGVYEINYKAALILASRVSLFMGDYDDAINYGEKLIAISPKLFNMVTAVNIATFTDPGLASSPMGRGFFRREVYGDPYDGNILNLSVNPDEIVFSFSSTSWKVRSDLISSLTTAMTYYVSTDDGLIGTYDKAKDTRYALYFIVPNPKFTANSIYPANGYAFQPTKWENMYNTMTGYCMTFRNVEAYLTLAEAYARKQTPDPARALTHLNTLLRSRIVGFLDLTPGNFASNELLVKRIWEERRKELCFEECHRWWDMRRQGQKPITRTWTITNETFRLEEKDPAFILNFPPSERLFDDNLIQNQRPDRKPV